MAHHHEHEGDSYYLDQLCLIALSGAFAAICLTMYFWQTQMLQLLLGEQFHMYILGSGVVLLGLVLVRSVSLWQMAGAAAKPHHEHEHDHHEHEHGHQHAPGEACTHDHHHHAPGEACTHDHHHEHKHDHQHQDCGHAHEAGHQHGPECGHQHHHGHAHGHDHDHDHGAAPWRYVVLMVPIMLFLLGLPSKGPKVRAADTSALQAEDASLYATILALAPNSPFLAPALLLAHADDDAQIKAARGVDFKTLEGIAHDASARDFWQGKYVTVVGQYAPSGNDRVFTLVRMRIQCCANDAIPLNVPILCKDSIAEANIPGLEPQGWVKVTGKIEFRERGAGSSGKMTVLLVANPQKQIVTTDAAEQIYIQ